LAAEFETPGIAVAVMDDFEFDEFTYGVSNLDTNKLVTRRTLFNVASISKLVTAHAIMHLVENGKVDLDKPIEKYLASWRFPKSSFNSNLITTRMVLNHSGGLSSEFGSGFGKEDPLIPLVDILSGRSEKRRSLRIVSEPGRRNVYSNLGFGLLQLLVKDVAGRSFREFVKENVLAKLKMADSNFRDPLSLDSTFDLATPYNYRLSPLDQERFVVVAAAGFLSNLQDLERLMFEETRGTKLLGKSSMDEMHRSDSTTGYGLGHMIVRNKDKVAYVGHSGLGVGWNSSFQFIPNSGQGIIVLTNGENGYYIHNTLTCQWYYSQTGKDVQSCKVAPDKKLNRIGFYLETGHAKGLLSKAEFETFQRAVRESRKSLKNDKFTKFVTQLSEIQLKLKSSVKDPDIQRKLTKAFESCYYWMNKPWYKK
jgi:CubicO group peptidase (beta-lactamase class C family)